MIPRLKAFLSMKELVAASSFWQGIETEDFEQEFAKLLSVKYALAFPYGRTGLICALSALNLKQKEVICPAYTCVVVAHAIVHSGNTPVFVDSEASTFNMDWGLVENAINDKTGAIIATSIFGHPVDLDAIKRFQEKYPDIYIIQDCAHSFAAQWNGQPVQKTGNCALFALNISKTITSIFGGMVTTDDASLYLQLKNIRAQQLKKSSMIKSLNYWLYLNAVYWGFHHRIYGIVNWFERTGWLKRFASYFDEHLIDMPKDYLEEMQAIQARVGLVQCKKYSHILEHRRKLANLYTSQLQHLSELVLPSMNAGSTHSHYVIRTSKARELIEHFRKKGVQLGKLIDYHIPSMPAYQKHQYFSNGISENWPGQVINLPVHCGVTEKNALMIIRYMHHFFNLNS